MLLGIGLLIALILAWYHGEQGTQRVSVPELIMIAGILTVAGVAIAEGPGIGYVHARAGNRAEAEAALRKLRAMEDASAYLLAMVHAALDDRDAAFRELERAVAQHDDYVGDLGVDDVFDPLRDDPRMAKLLKQIGLPTRRPSS